MVKTFFIIVNNQASNGLKADVWQNIRTRLDSRKISYIFRKTKQVGNAKSLTKRYVSHLTKEEADETVVIVIGGDGTLTEVLNGIKETPYKHVPLAFIPIGENNGFAQGIGIASNPMTALEQILSATEPVYYDIGEYTETTHQSHGYFFNDFGIGLDAFVISLNTQAHKHKRLQKLLNKFHLKFLAYMVSAFEALINQESFSATIRIGEKYEFFKHVAFVNVANHPYFDNGIVLSPTANVNDHKLDLLIADNLGFFKFIILAISIYFKKQLKLPYLHHYKSDQIHLIINSLEFGQIDGEEIGNGYFDIFYKTSQYPFWMNISSVPPAKRR
ncbi:diacylglycerol/lipid kinase family protein [Ligilactobacillus ruminis]|nr:YegS/Rv2252/BmrU family lipid kinase [Ligilactobacillus ruminis]UWP39524.1 YegS/Rv2252/BmrU family lipid kinase [Ligilactobacillus ruminis]